VDVEDLKRIPLFAAFSDEELTNVAPHAGERAVAEGDPVANGHEELVLIDAGTAEVWQDERHIADLGPGDYFVPGPLVVASSPVRVITLSPSAARRLALH
jgi:hypothetical protein